VDENQPTTDPTPPDLISSISTKTDDAPAIRERQGQTWGAHQEIAAGMEVIDADGSHLGTVETVAEGEIKLTRGDGDPEHRLLPLSLVDVVSDGRVMMRRRGDDAFGLEG
jgi:hypothetical protein